MLNKHSLNRVKKKINDFIIGNYNQLFFNDSKTDGTLTRDDIFENPKLLTKVQDELRLSTEQDKAPCELL